MKAHTVEFPCKIGDEVRVRDVPDLKGRVVGLCQRVWGTTIAVIWWQDGRRHEEWLHDWEVQRVTAISCSPFCVQPDRDFFA